MNVEIIGHDICRESLTAEYRKEFSIIFPLERKGLEGHIKEWNQNIKGILEVVLSVPIILLVVNTQQDAKY
jgi:hypothetical protein